MGLLKEQCAEWRKAPLLYCCNQVWMTIGGQILWNVTPICETYQIYYLIWRRPMKDVLGNHLKGPIIPFRSLVEYHPITAKDQSRIHQFGKKVLPGLFLGYALSAGKFWKGDVLVADLEELETMDASETTQKDSMRKRWYFPNKENLFCPIADVRIKTLGGDQELRTSTLIRQRPMRGESRLDFLGEPEESLPPPHDSFPDASEAINDFWSVSGKLHIPPSRWTQSQALLAERRIIPYSTEVYWRVQKLLIARETHRWLLEYRWVKRFVWLLNRFHSIYSIRWKNSKRIYVVRGEINEKTAYIQARSSVARTLGRKWERMPSWRRSKKDRMKSSIWITHKNCEGSISVTRRIRNSRKPSRMLVRNWKHQLLLLCPAKLWRRIVGVVHPTKIKTRLACILEAGESTRLRMGESLPNHHEDHIAGKGNNSLQHHNLVHKFIPMPQALKTPDAKAAVEKEWEKLEKIPAWQLAKVRNKKEVIKEAKTKDIKVHFASLMEICHLKNAELEAKHQKYKGRVVLRGDIVKDNSGSYAVFTEQGSSASQMTATKVMDIISRLPEDVQDKQLMQCPLARRSTWKMHQRYYKIPVRMSRCLDTFIKAQMTKIMVQYGSPSRSSWTKSVRSSFGRTIMGKAIWESSIGTRLGTVLNWECFFVNRARGQLLSVWTTSNWQAGQRT